MPDGTKSLPEPISTDHQQGLVAFISVRAIPLYSWHEWELGILNLRLQPHFPGANELKSHTTPYTANMIIEKTNIMSVRWVGMSWTSWSSWPFFWALSSASCPAAEFSASSVSWGPSAVSAASRPWRGSPWWYRPSSSRCQVGMVGWLVGWIDLCTRDIFPGPVKGRPHRWPPELGQMGTSTGWNSWR